MTMSSPRQREIVTASLDRLGVIVPVASLITSAAVVAVHFEVQAWQLLATAALLLINALAFLVARLLARQGLEGEGGVLMVVTVWIVFAGAALLAAGAGSALGATAGLAGMLMAVLVLAPRRRPWFWLGSVAVGIAIWASGALAVPWPRFDVNASPATWLGVRLLLGSVIVVLAVLSMRAHRRATLLPTRLTVLAVVVVLITTAAMRGVSTLLETLDARERVYAHLETDIVLKREAISSWADRLYGVLDDLAILDDGTSDFLDGSPADSAAQVDREAAGRLRGELDLALRYTQAFHEIALVDARGIALVSTDPAHEGARVEGDFLQQEDGARPGMAPAVLESASKGGVLTFVRPLVRDGKPLGMLVGWADLTALQQIAQTGTEEMRIGTYLVGPDYALLTEAWRPEGVAAAHSEAIDVMVQERAPVPGRASYMSHSGIPVLGAYVWDPDLLIGIVSEVPSAEALAVGKTTTFIHVGVAVLAALVAGAMAFAVAQDIVQPLSMLSDSALSIADGDLDQVVEVACDDEVGALAESFNVMSAQLQDVVGGLNRRLRVQTRALQAVADASQLAGSALDERALLGRIVELIQERFALAYAGLFLLDEEGRYAVLRAGTGEAGVTMLASGWRLLCGGASMIGQCVATGESLVSQRAGDSVVRLENPLLPNVRSEAAIPIRCGARVLGAVTVQSLQRGAFSDADLSALQALADVVALALQPASLVGRGRAASESHIAASEGERAEDVVSYEYQGTAVDAPDRVLPTVALDVQERRGAAVDGDTLLVPLMQGDAVMGLLGVERPGGWSPDTIALVTALAEELERVTRGRPNPRTVYVTTEPAAGDS